MLSRGLLTCSVSPSDRGQPPTCASLGTHRCSRCEAFHFSQTQSSLHKLRDEEDRGLDTVDELVLSASSSSLSSSVCLWCESSSVCEDLNLDPQHRQCSLSPFPLCRVVSPQLCKSYVLCPFLDNIPVEPSEQPSSVYSRLDCSLGLVENCLTECSCDVLKSVFLPSTCAWSCTSPTSSSLTSSSTSSHESDPQGVVHLPVPTRTGISLTTNTVTSTRGVDTATASTCSLVFNLLSLNDVGSVSSIQPSSGAERGVKSRQRCSGFATSSVCGSVSPRGLCPYSGELSRVCLEFESRARVSPSVPFLQKSPAGRHRQGPISPDRKGFPPDHKGFPPHQKGVPPHDKGFPPHQNGFPRQGFPPHHKGSLSLYHHPVSPPYCEQGSLLLHKQGSPSLSDQGSSSSQQRSSHSPHHQRSLQHYRSLSPHQQGSLSHRQESLLPQRQESPPHTESLSTRCQGSLSLSPCRQDSPFRQTPLSSPRGDSDSDAQVDSMSSSDLDLCEDLQTFELAQHLQDVQPFHVCDGPQEAGASPDRLASNTSLTPSSRNGQKFRMMSLQEFEQLPPLPEDCAELPALWEDGGALGSEREGYSVGGDLQWDSVKIFTDDDAPGNAEGKQSFEQKSSVIEQTLSEIYASPFQQLIYASPQQSSSNLPSPKHKPRKTTSFKTPEPTTTDSTPGHDRTSRNVVIRNEENRKDGDNEDPGEKSGNLSFRGVVEEEKREETVRVRLGHDTHGTMKASIARAAQRAVSGYRTCDDADNYVGAWVKPTLILARAPPSPSGILRRPNKKSSAKVSQGSVRWADGRPPSLPPTDDDAA